MIDVEYKVRRYISIFSNETEWLIDEIELMSFDLNAFQKVFNEREKEDPMFECYEIKPEHTSFIEIHLSTKPEWDFDRNAYFLEAHALE